MGIARCIRLKEPPNDIPRSSHREYRTRSSDESESGESLLLTTMAPSASVPPPAGAGEMRMEAAGSLVAMLVPVVALATRLAGASVEASLPEGGGWSCDGSMTVYTRTVLATADIYIVAQQVTELMMSV